MIAFFALHQPRLRLRAETPDQPQHPERLEQLVGEIARRLLERLALFLERRHVRIVLPPTEGGTR